MKAAGTLLVVVVMTNGCNLEAIDNAEVTTVRFESAQECDAQAAILDARKNQRAVCVDAK